MTNGAFKGFSSYQPKDFEDYMNETHKAHFKTLLNTWKQKLIEDRERTVNHLQGEHLNLPDPNDRASQEEEFSIELRARERECKLLRKIDKALNRLANDEYGFCESCGTEIGIRRLAARPTAELCIDCKHWEERKEKTWAA